MEHQEQMTKQELKKAKAEARAAERAQLKAEYETKMRELSVELELANAEEQAAIEELDEERYQNAIAQQKAIRAKQKALRKETRVGIELVSWWIWLFAVIQFIISSPLAVIIWSQVFIAIFNAFEDSLLPALSQYPDWLRNLVVILMLFIFPIVNMLVSWILYNFAVKKDIREERLAFKIVWGCQGALTLAMMLWILIKYVIPMLK